MKKLLRSVFLATVVAFAATAGADQPPVTVGEDEYGCCCPWAYWSGICPVDFYTFFGMVDEVCVLIDEDGEIAGYCADDPEGVYLFRGMTWPQLAEFFEEYYGIDPTLGSVVDFFCGIGRTHPPGYE